MDSGQTTDSYRADIGLDLGGLLALIIGIAQLLASENRVGVALAGLITAAVGALALSRAWDHRAPMLAGVATGLLVLGSATTGAALALATDPGNSDPAHPAAASPTTTAATAMSTLSSTTAPATANATDRSPNGTAQVNGASLSGVIWGPGELLFDNGWFDLDVAPPKHYSGSLPGRADVQVFENTGATAVVRVDRSGAAALWTKSGAPSLAECTELLQTHSQADVEIAEDFPPVCVRTTNGNVGLVDVTKQRSDGDYLADVTVWAKAPAG
jgi:hypothetical protein